MSTWWFHESQPILFSFDAWNVWYPLFTNKNLRGKGLTASFGPSSWGPSFCQVTGSKSSHQRWKDFIPGISMPWRPFSCNLGKIWSNFEDHWGQLKIMKIHFMSISSYGSPVFWMDISHSRFGRGQVLCSRGSWQGQGWKSIQRCLMMVLCPMLAKCWQIYGTPFAGVEKGESCFHPLVNRRRDCLNIYDPQILCRVFFQYTTKYASKHIWILLQHNIDRYIFESYIIIYIYIITLHHLLPTSSIIHHQTPCVSHLFPGPEGCHRWAGGDASWCPCRASGIPSGREAAIFLVGWKSEVFLWGGRKKKQVGNSKLTFIYGIYLCIYIYFCVY